MKSLKPHILRIKGGLRQLRSRRWMALSLAFVVLSAATLWYMALPPVSKAYGDYQSWLSKKDQVGREGSWEGKVRTLRRATNELHARLDSLFVTVPNGDRMSAVMSVLSVCSANANVEVQNVQPQPEVLHDTHAELPLTLTVHGSFHAVGRFVDAVERSRFLINVDALEVKARRSERTSPSQDDLEGIIKLRLISLR